MKSDQLKLRCMIDLLEKFLRSSPILGCHHDASEHHSLQALSPLHCKRKPQHDILASFPQKIINRIFSTDRPIVLNSFWMRFIYSALFECIENLFSYRTSCWSIILDKIHKKPENCYVLLWNMNMFHDF